MRSYLLLLAILMTGTAATFFAPLQSLFLVKEHNVPAQYVGIYAFVATLISIVVSQTIAKYSDKQTSRVPGVLVLSAIAVASMLVMATAANVWVVIGVGLLGVTFISTIAPQLYAMARENYQGSRPELYMSWARAMISLAWVIGPPIAFGMVAKVGFQNTFFVASLLYVMVGLVSLTFFNATREVAPKAVDSNGITNDEAGRFWTPSVLVVSAGFACFYIALNSYTMLLPLYVVDSLKQDIGLVGGIFSVAALIEIPAILLCGLVLKRFGSVPMVVSASVALTIYLVSIAVGNSLMIIYIMVPVAALALALNASAGLEFYQSLAPHRLGYASTLYTNLIRLGMGVGALLFGLAGFVSLNAAMLIAGCMAGLSFVLLAVGAVLAKKEQEEADMEHQLEIKG